MKPTDFASDARHLRLDTLVRLRWLAVTGQAVAVAGVRFGLGFELPFALCLVAISSSAWINVVLRIKYRANHRLGRNATTAILAFDILQLTVLLYLTGGLENPFAMLFLAPVLISATTLSPERTVCLGLLTAFATTILAMFHQPLPWFPDREVHVPFLYVTGIWTAILLGTGFTGIFAWRIAEEARQLAQALSATELVLAREQHLSQLDGLAAAAAHELGTPLATIALVAKEMANSVPQNGPLHEDLILLREQVDRCRSILTKLSSIGQDQGDFLDNVTIRHLIEEVVEPQRNLGVHIDVIAHGDGPEPLGLRNPGVMYSLANILDNAADFAADTVTVEATWNADQIQLEIRDDGPGFAPDVLLHAGEPYVTTRKAEDRDPDDTQGGGLGLGLFISKTLIERSGAELTFANLSPPSTGAVTRIVWPRQAFSPTDQASAA